MERTKTHESQYASSLIEASLDPLITISPTGIITDMNRAFIKITGSTREKITGTDFGIYFTEPKKARKIYKEVFEKGFVTNYPLVVIDGELTEVLFNGSVYKDISGNLLGAVVVARDVTEQKRIERELTEAKIIAEKAADIAEQAKAKAELLATIAEDAVKAKQQFLSNMSHEIRTPMNAIIGFTKVVLKTDLSIKQKEYITAIKTSGDALVVLINDILDLAKVDAGKMIFEKIPFKMEASISSTLHLFEAKIHEKNLELKVEYDDGIPALLLGDPVRLHQIILNLLSNAVKFTTKGKITVCVRLLSVFDEMATIEFVVSDTGIGIAKDKLDNIFENFQQASSITSRLYGGTGLGLAIVKKLVESQGGTIRVISETGAGSTFSFIMSFQKTTSEISAEVEVLELDREINGIKVLVVEDILLNQLLMKTILEDFGFEWEIAANGKIAIEKLENKVFDLVLMDLQMPEMNGFEATEYIRGAMKSDIPIIALTADVTTMDFEKCKAVGMNEYIAKPVDENLLYAKILGVLKPLKSSKDDGLDLSHPGVKTKYCDLNYLINRTKSDPILIMEVISAYLGQTPELVETMKRSYEDRDRELLQATVHKMMSSFSIMGFDAEYENLAKKVLKFTASKQKLEGIADMVLQIENVCLNACIELQEEFNKLKNSTIER